MPYREEQDALQERLDALTRELEALRAQTRDLGELKAREVELAGDVARTAATLEKMRGRRSLPMLDNLQIASPCNASWDDMQGDERVRFCGKCEKNVFNLSAMPRAEAEKLLEERIGGEVCVRFYQRADGTVMTQDCPVGVKRKRRRRLAFAVAGAGAMIAAGVQAFASAAEHKSSVATGAVRPEFPDAPQQVPTPQVMGTIAPTVLPPPKTTAGRDKPQVRMGGPRLPAHPPSPPKATKKSPR
ncbi:MAG: hypothetical protein R3B36_25345 [Polyangiaceae bacterium]